MVDRCQHTLLCIRIGPWGDDVLIPASYSSVAASSTVSRPRLLPVHLSPHSSSSSHFFHQQFAPSSIYSCDCFLDDDVEWKRFNKRQILGRKAPVVFLCSSVWFRVSHWETGRFSSSDWGLGLGTSYLVSRDWGGEGNVYNQTQLQ